MIWDDDAERRARQEREKADREKREKAAQAGGFASESENGHYGGGGKYQCIVSFLVFLCLIWKPIITFKV